MEGKKGKKKRKRKKRWGWGVGGEKQKTNSISTGWAGDHSRVSAAEYDTLPFY